MSPSEASSTWDFTPVINLLHSFTPEPQKKALQTWQSPTLKSPDASKDGAGSREQECTDDAECKLGDFGALWTFLSRSRPSALDAISEPAAPEASGSHSNEKPNATVTDPLEATVERHTEREGTQAKKILLRKSPLLDNTGSNSAKGAIFERPVIQILKNPNLNRAQQSPFPEAAPQEPSKIKQPVVTKTTPSTPLKARSKSPKKNTPKVLPRLTGSSADRRANLIELLRECHNNQRHLLANPNLCNPEFISSNISSTGIHIFIDTSNVMVGFHDCIKIARNIPTTVRVPRLPLSFHNFSLVLERGRQVHKRVLVGSDRFPAIDEAEKLGYETNILVRVQKAKEASPRKKNGNDAAAAKSYGNTQQDHSSGSETNSRPVREKWVEQAVDEILHLKILESIVDTDRPSTIVLVTGDAAEAEYSDGFMKMVERALQKGWRVELVSFSCTISRAYSRKDFRSKWGSKFTIIELDKYAEHLLDM
ncbi:predicted protein [Uncinocarpus reesii 1704]|uniref:NYN domain-containing protein n=1 Tax=Uncinocarpus reesii (strain UAMH 1704) TaxID=336963 RepID=C4JSL6_UNCRE|nr:uncharacterized protein UREG_05455 [Uncinocarpus reesii 1704]EEP80613.1 predicted protein [Uncinocarpus reesii 1704]